MDSNWLPLIIFAVVWVAAWSFHYVRARDRRDLFLKLLDKFATGEELERFLQTPEGKRLLDRMAGRRWGRRAYHSNDMTLGDHDARTAMIQGIYPAIILAFVAGGLAVAGIIFGHERLLIPALIIGSVAVGLIIASLVALRIAKSNDDPRLTGGR